MTEREKSIRFLTKRLSELELTVEDLEAIVHSVDTEGEDDEILEEFEAAVAEARSVEQQLAELQASPESAIS